MKIGVVIPVLKEIDNLKNLLFSLDNQTNQKLIYKIIIAVGDENIKDYESQCSQFKNLAGKIKIVRNIRKITPAALNIGVRELQRDSVDVVQFFGAHSYINEEFFSKLHGVIKKNPEIDIFNSSLSFTPAESMKERAIQLFTYSRFGRNWKSFLSPSAKGFVTGIFAVKMEVFEKVGLFDERFVKNQDLHFIKKALEKKFKSRLFTELVYLYKVRPSITETLKQMSETGRYISNDLKGANLKHLAPFAFYSVVFILIILILLTGIKIISGILIVITAVYIIAITLESFKYFLNKEKSSVFLPFLFISSHLSYAAGTFYGLILRVIK